MAAARITLRIFMVSSVKIGDGTIAPSMSWRCFRQALAGSGGNSKTPFGNAENRRDCSVFAAKIRDFPASGAGETPAPAVALDYSAAPKTVLGISRIQHRGRRRYFKAAD